MLLKRSLPFLVAVLIGLILFLIMQLMIKPDTSLLQKSGDNSYLNFVRVKLNEQQAKTKDRQLPKEPQPPEPPPQSPELEVSQSSVSQRVQPMAMNLPSLDMPLNSGSGPFIGVPGSMGGGMSAFDSDVIPVVQVPPAYPRNAKQARIEGFVTMNVTIRPDGSVSNVKVVKAQPKRLFDKAAMAAMLRWKFRPKIVDGQPVAQRAEQTIEFKLGNS